MSTVESQPAYKDARLIVVMGSSGCGKSTIGAALAALLKSRFIEGDDYHPPENKAKMSSGTPLTDDDRRPWLTQFAGVLRKGSDVTVASCSALKRRYREQINNTAQEPVLYIYLQADKALLEERLAGREGHFMDKGLLDSQLAALEPPAVDEFSMNINIDKPVAQILDDIVQQLGRTTEIK